MCYQTCLCAHLWTQYCLHSESMSSDTGERQVYRVVTIKTPDTTRLLPKGIDETGIHNPRGTLDGRKGSNKSNEPLVMSNYVKVTALPAKISP